MRPSDKDELPDWRKWIAEEDRVLLKKPLVAKVFKHSGYTIAFIISRRSTILAEPEKRRPMDPYHHKMYEEMMRKWR